MRSSCQKCPCRLNTGRFAYALERPFNEDRLVGFIIPCESLFVSDAPAQRNLSNTLAHRVATVLSKSPNLMADYSARDFDVNLRGM